MMEEYLKEDLILSAFEESELIKNFVFRDTVESTNTLARELAEMGEPEITVVWAEAQTQVPVGQATERILDSHHALMRGDVCQHRPFSSYVADGIDMRHGGAHAVVYRDTFAGGF